MTDTDTGGWPLGEVLANSYQLAVKEAAKLKALNAELLAALIQMENWASLYQVALDEMTLQQYEQATILAGDPVREIKIARAVIAKAKELDQ